MICKIKNLLKKSIPKSVPAYRDFQIKLESLLNRHDYNRKHIMTRRNESHEGIPSPALSRLLKFRRAKSNISSLISSYGKLYSDDKNIKKIAFEFYKNLYRNVKIDRNSLSHFLDAWPGGINAIHWRGIESKFNIEELEIIIKKSRGLKAPGSDGLPALIYKLFPPVAQEILLIRLNEFLDGSYIPDSWKTGMISLIYKSGSRKEISNYRPITLLRTDYKLLALLITRRIYSMICDHINIEQVGFMPRRLIYDNILVVNELLREKEKFLISVDFQKAYDSVSHDTLYLILKHINMPIKLINLIMEMYRNTKTKIIINNELTRAFDVKRGVKQGDPLAPLLFTLIVELLSKFANKNFIGKRFGDFHVKILLNADDVILVPRDEKEFTLWINTLKKFELATGLQINSKKSFYVSHKQMKVSIPRMVEKFKYLGFEFDSNGLLQSDKILISKLNNSFRGWSDISWDIRTNVSIVKSYILSRIMFHSYLIDMKSHSDDIDKQIKKFVFFYKQSGRYKMRSKRFQLPKKLNGLGLWNMDKRFESQWAWLARIAIGYPNMKISNNPKLCDKQSVELSEIYSSIINISRPILTERQKDIVKRIKIDISPIPHLLRNVSSNPLFLNFIWNFVNGVLPTSGRKCARCGDSGNYKHIFFHCPDLKSSRTLLIIKKYLITGYALTPMDGPRNKSTKKC